MVLKRLGAISFGLAFLTGLFMYLEIGRSVVSPATLRILFLVFGALGLFFNLITFTSGKHSPMYSFAYWMSSLIIFAGLIFRLMHWPMSNEILIGGLICFGATMFIPSKRVEDRKQDDELLDNI